MGSATYRVSSFRLSDGVSEVVDVILGNLSAFADDVCCFAEKPLPSFDDGRHSSDSSSSSQPGCGRSVVLLVFCRVILDGFGFMYSCCGRLFSCES